MFSGLGEEDAEDTGTGDTVQAGTSVVVAFVLWAFASKRAGAGEPSGVTVTRSPRII